jgi:hypothetical protein
VEKRCEVCDAPFLVGSEDAGFPTWAAKRCSAECRRATHYMPSATANALSPMDAAYMAGFVDGEGCVGVGEHNKAAILHVRFAVRNCNRDVLEWCKRTTGVGAIVVSFNSNPRWKTSYSWVVSSGAAVSVLAQLAPYVKIKAPQIGLAIAFHERLQTPSLRVDRVWQREWMAKMKAMNARGPKKEPEPCKEPG